ncbi:hypothetical protein [Campylobacter troglodytis]|uniref:hypothetical protein n=1 Tax=Campylobacter troglodytis TaxID=654363 RepID=UPI0011576A9B|nr:hypothetical protein [Campylobacter troglodytis]TQR61066.1 hypothetical protein DMC01_02730 [Campylobacter troglodytis]
MSFAAKKGLKENFKPFMKRLKNSKFISKKPFLNSQKLFLSPNSLAFLKKDLQKNLHSFCSNLQTTQRIILSLVKITSLTYFKKIAQILCMLNSQNTFFEYKISHLLQKNSSILNCSNLQKNSKFLIFNSYNFYLVLRTFLNLRKLKNVLA